MAGKITGWFGVSMQVNRDYYIIERMEWNQYLKDLKDIKSVT